MFVINKLETWFNVIATNDYIDCTKKCLPIIEDTFSKESNL